MNNVEIIKFCDSIRENITARTGRSAWSKGVSAYASELVDDLEAAALDGYADLEALTAVTLKRTLLNGADDWLSYSWGGCSLIYNEDIARRLCSPSELAKTRNGERKPNRREEWLDTQARALFQAAELIRLILQ